MNNPMDGYRDIIPWPHDWSRDVGSVPISNLVTVMALWPALDAWTYGEHWSVYPTFDKTDQELIVDLYWSDDDEYRLQLPPEVGFNVVALLVFQIPEKIRTILWFHQRWTSLTGWEPYMGEQGDFVDHIHIEFLPEEE